MGRLDNPVPFQVSHEQVAVREARQLGRREPHLPLGARAPSDGSLQQLRIDGGGRAGRLQQTPVLYNIL
jgi:hypothetical protein